MKNTKRAKSFKGFADHLRNLRELKSKHGRASEFWNIIIKATIIYNNIKVDHGW